MVCDGERLAVRQTPKRAESLWRMKDGEKEGQILEWFHVEDLDELADYAAPMGMLVWWCTERCSAGTGAEMAWIGWHDPGLRFRGQTLC